MPFIMGQDVSMPEMFKITIDLYRSNVKYTKTNPISAKPYLFLNLPEKMIELKKAE